MADEGTVTIMKRQDQFSDLPDPWPEVQKSIEALANQANASQSQRGTDGVRYEVPPNVSKAMAAIATNVWRAKGRMLDGGSGEIREEMKRVHKHIESVLEIFQEIGLEVKDHTGEPFDYGLPLKVLTTQPTQGLSRESVIETIKPTIYWQKQIVQIGEVVIATPA